MVGGAHPDGTSDAPAPVLLTGTAVSRTGLISVETTEMGLPVALSVEGSELWRDPSTLAHDIMRLCKQAANRARLARRAELVEAGIERDVLALLGLPTADEVAVAEIAEEDEYDYEPQSWLRTGYE